MDYVNSHVHVGVRNLGHGDLVCRSQQVVLDLTDPSDVLYVLILGWVRGQVLGPDRHSLDVLRLLLDVNL